MSRGSSLRGEQDWSRLTMSRPRQVVESQKFWVNLYVQGEQQ
jgi:hypothetical protein